MTPVLVQDSGAIKRMSKKRFISVLKIAVTCILFYFILIKLDIGLFFEAIANALTDYFLISVFWFVVWSFIEVLKFRSASMLTYSLSTSFKLVFVGLFFNNFLPSSVGGDGYKVYLMKQLGTSLKNGTAFVLSDRITGLLALLALGVFGFALHIESRVLIFQILENNSYQMADKIIFLSLIAIFVLSGIAVFIFFKKIKKFINKNWKHFHHYFKKHGIQTFLWALLFQLSRALAILYLAKCFGFELNLWAIFVVLFLMSTITLLPVSLGGLGIREGTLVYLLYAYGMPLESATAVALIHLAVILAKALIGGIIFLLYKKENKMAAG